MIWLTPSDSTNHKKMDLFLTPTEVLLLMFLLRGKRHIPCHIPSREQISQIYDQNDIDNFVRVSANAGPTNKNYAPELSTFGIIIEVNHSEVQWNSLSLEKLPS